MAAALFYRGEADKAEQLLQQAVKLKIADGETYYNLGEFLFESGDRQSAMNYYSQSVTAGFIPAYIRVARLKEITGDDTGAMRLLNQPQGKAPDRADVYYERAIVNYRRSRFSEALADFQRTRELMPNDRALLYNIGVTYFRMNDFTNARTYLQQFLQNAPPNMKDERRLALEILRQK